MKFIFFCLLIITTAFLSLSSCKDKNTSADSTTITRDSTATNSINDTAEIKETILSFYNWYVPNWEKLSQFKLYRGETPPYKMDWDEVNKLHAYIRGSVPQLGEEFISNQVQFLKQSDSAFKVDLQDEMPYGFDYDWYTNSQEDPVYLRDALVKSTKWTYNVNGDRAVVDVKGKWFDDNKETESTIMKFDMKKESGKWKIAKIGAE